MCVAFLLLLSMELFSVCFNDVLQSLSFSQFGVRQAAVDGLAKEELGRALPVMGWGVILNIHKCLFLSAFSFLISVMDVYLASSSSALSMTLCSTSAHLKYVCNSCESFSLTGDPPSFLIFCRILA